MVAMVKRNVGVARVEHAVAVDVAEALRAIAFLVVGIGVDRARDR